MISPQGGKRNLELQFIIYVPGILTKTPLMYLNFAFHGLVEEAFSNHCGLRVDSPDVE